MKKETSFRRELKRKLEYTLGQFPEGKLVKGRYRAIRHVIGQFYPSVANMDKESALEMIRAVVYLDRQHRLQTEGIDNETKEIESQEFQMQELGMETGYYEDVKKLESLNNEIK